MKDNTTTPDESVAILIVGDPGSRKTTLALHAPGPYVFDMDHNLAAAARFMSSTRPGFEYYYDQAAIDDSGKEIPMRDRYAWMNTCITKAVEHPKVKTIIPDSATSFTDILIAEIRRQVPKLSNPAEPLRIQDWGLFAHLFKEIVTRLRHSGKTLIFPMHQRVEKDEADGSWKTFLNVPGQTGQFISGLFSDVWNPYPHITGVGGTQIHQWMVRTLPISDRDHRGVKSSFGFKVTEKYEDVAKKLASL